MLIKNQAFKPMGITQHTTSKTNQKEQKYA